MNSRCSLCKILPLHAKSRTTTFTYSASDEVQQSHKFILCVGIYLWHQTRCESTPETNIVTYYGGYNGWWLW